MKRNMVLILSLALIAISLFADDGSEKNNWSQIFRDREAKANHLKQSINFVGNVEYEHENMELSALRGKFTDIVITDMCDYHHVVAVIDSIATRLLPFIGAREGQCIKYFISVDRSKASVQYSQRAYGYMAGSLTISYYANSSYFTIANWTKCIPDDEPGPIITEQEALTIANQGISREHVFGPRGNGLEYIYPSDNSTIATLCYEYNNDFYYVLVDARTGEVLVRNKKESI